METADDRTSNFRTEWLLCRRGYSDNDNLKNENLILRPVLPDDSGVAASYLCYLQYIFLYPIIKIKIIDFTYFIYA
jgi:hypothetical protein